MSEQQSQNDPADEVSASTAGAVVVGVTPDQPERVLKVAARYAALLGAPLVVVNVDVMRFCAISMVKGVDSSRP